MTEIWFQPCIILLQKDYSAWQKNDLLNMMKLRLLVEVLKFIVIFHELGKKLHFNNQVSNEKIEKYIIHLICFSKIYSLLYLLQIFTEHKSHHSSEIKPEPNWYSCDASISTSDYRVQQGTFYYQPDTYKQRQKYFHDRTTKQVTYRTDYDRWKVEKSISIHSGIPTPYI